MPNFTNLGYRVIEELAEGTGEHHRSGKGRGVRQGLRTQEGRRGTRPGPLRLRAPHSNHAVAPSRRGAGQGSVRGFGNIVRGRPLRFFANDGNKNYLSSCSYAEEAVHVW